jgi:hypothetical protein
VINTGLKLRKHILKCISILGLILLAVHFTLVSVAVAPYSWSQPDIYYVADRYVKPQFRQYWQLFAPVPRDQSKLYFRYFSEDSWSDTISLGDEMEELNLPFSNRIAVKSVYYLGRETRKNTQFALDGSKDYRLVKASGAYYRAVHVCLFHTKTKFKLRPDSIELILKRELFPKPGFTQTKLILDNYGVERLE